MQHLGIRLAGSFIGGAGGIEQAMQLHSSKCFIEPHPALAGGHGQPMLALAQGPEQRQHAIEQADIVLVPDVVVTVTLPEFGVFVLGHIGRRVGQGRYQCHANHIGGRPIIGHRATHITHRLLDATRDDARGVEQGAIPVEGNQVIAAEAGAEHGQERPAVREGVATRGSPVARFADG